MLTCAFLLRYIYTSSDLVTVKEAAFVTVESVTLLYLCFCCCSGEEVVKQLQCCVKFVRHNFKFYVSVLEIIT